MILISYRPWSGGLGPPHLLLPAILAAIALYGLTKWQPWASRLHLPLFLIAIPTVALIITRCVGLTIAATTRLFLLTQAWLY